MDALPRRANAQRNDRDAVRGDPPLGHLPRAVLGVHYDSMGRAKHGRLVPGGEPHVEGMPIPKRIPQMVDDDDEAMMACWPGFVHELERRAARHRNREALLAFFRNHVIVHEIYRLSERDLKSIELLPVEEEARMF